MSKTIKVSPAVIHKFRKFAKKSSHPIRSQIRVEPNRMVATDSYKMLIVETKTAVKEPVLLDGAAFYSTYKKRGDDVNIKVIEDNAGLKYPDYEKILPKTKPKYVVNLCAELLMDMAREFKDGNTNEVHVEIREYGQPVVFHNGKEDGEKIIGLIMPRKD